MNKSEKAFVALKRKELADAVARGDVPRVKELTRLLTKRPQIGDVLPFVVGKRQGERQ